MSYINPHVNMYRFLKDPEAFQKKLLKKWGDPFPFHLPGFPTIWMTQNPESVKKIFTVPLGSFIPSPHNPVAPLLGNNGLIMLGGQEHTQSRKDLGPNFMGQQLKRMGKLIADVYFEIRNEMKLGSETLVLQKFTQAVTLRIVLRLIFPHVSHEEILEIENCTKKFLESYSPTLLFTPKWIPGRWSVFLKSKKNLDDLFYKHYLQGVEQNIEGPVKSIAEKNPEKEQVLDQLRTLVVAGHETTATSLVWIIFLIHQKQHEEFKKLLLNDIEKFEPHLLDNINDLVYLDAVVNESLRIHPPVPFITRKIVESFELDSKKLKADEEIGVSITLLHHSTAIWNKPELFMPQRFIEKKYAPHEFAPFGGSNRKCIGAGLALSELKILTGLLMKDFEITLCNDEFLKPQVMQITIGPKKPIRLELKSRLVSKN
ncbi:MAG: cytochrome P450 [Rhizobacter sp.]|nr:cytochrome P450 [Bacteriovorax sp.]